MDYLKLTDSNRQFSSSILQILIEDHRSTHVECINNSRNLIFLKAGDIVMARPVIQSNISKNKIVKLSYYVRGLYLIVRRTVFCSYYVRKLHKPDSSELKFMAYDSYPLPPYLKPCDPVERTDTRYLNQTNTPLVHPLKNTLHIELYNEKWFTKPIPTSEPPIT